jgi:murein DD-endopeptidase MepM/ murein hydrolase activator NlpD
MRLDKSGRLRNGPVDRVESYAAYGARIPAITDGTVVSTLDGLPDQVPQNLPDPSIIMLANVDGNHVVLDIGHGFYAFYAHMKSGSVRVRVGQKFRAGMVLGRLGNSGNSSAPHLQFHIMDSASVLGSEGLPYVIDRFKFAGNIPDLAVPADMGGNFRRYLLPISQFRKEQFPLDLDVIDFWQ